MNDGIELFPTRKVKYGLHIYVCILYSIHGYDGYLLYDVVKKKKLLLWEPCFAERKPTSPDLPCQWDTLDGAGIGASKHIKTSTNSTLPTPDHATQSAMRKVLPPAAAILPCPKVAIFNEMFGQGDNAWCSFGSAAKLDMLKFSWYSNRRTWEFKNDGTC